MNLMNSPAQRFKDHTRWMLGGDFHTWLVSVSKEHRWRVLEIFSATPHPQLCSLGAVDFLNQVWDALIFIYKGRTWKFPSIVDKAWWFAGKEKTVSILWQWMLWCNDARTHCFHPFSCFFSVARCRHVILGRSSAWCFAAILAGAHIAGTAAMPSGWSTTGVFHAGGAFASTELGTRMHQRCRTPGITKLSIL